MYDEMIYFWYELLLVKLVLVLVKLLTNAFNLY